MPSITPVRTLLSLDTSGAGFSIALMRGEGLIAEMREERPGRQAALLIPAIERLLRGAGMAYRDLHAVIAAAGPGGFTGLRIGLSAAQGIALAAHIPAQGVNVLHALAHAASAQGTDGELWTVVNAGKGEVAAQRFVMQAGFARPQGEAFLAAPDALLLRVASSARVAGHIFLLPGIAHLAYAGVSQPDAAMFARFAVASPEGLLPPHPLYVRPPDAKLPI